MGITGLLVDPVPGLRREHERECPAVGPPALEVRDGDLAAPRVAAAVDAIERRFLGPEVPGRRVQAADELTDDSPFTDVQSRRFPRRGECAPEDYVDRLGTVSRYLALAAPIRADALRSVREVLPRRVAVDESTELLLARRREAR